MKSSAADLLMLIMVVAGYAVICYGVAELFVFIVRSICTCGKSCC